MYTLNVPPFSKHWPEDVFVETEIRVCNQKLMYWCCVKRE